MNSRVKQRWSYVVPALVALGVFFVLTLGVVWGLLEPLDHALLRALHTLASPGLTQFAVALSLLGSGWAITPLAGVAYLGLRRKSRSASRLFIATVGGGLFLFLAVVFLIDRPRPTLFDSPVSEPTASFPSGHAMNATVVLLSLHLVLGSIDASWRRPLAWFGVAVVLGVSLSRLYLQIHYPSDIVAGIALGTGWVLLISGYGLRRLSNEDPG